MGQPGLYATFKTYHEEDEEEYIDKGYWGEINNMEDILDDEPPEGWEEDNQGIIWICIQIYLNQYTNNIILEYKL